MKRKQECSLIKSCRILAAAWLLTASLAPGLAQVANAPAARQKVIFDTDIGDDIDDAFALDLALVSPEIDVLGVTTAWGDTALRARLVSRMLCDVGRSDIPVFAGPATQGKTTFTQAKWARGFAAPEKPWPDAIAFILNKIKENPGEITLISVAPFTNVGKLIDTDPATFRKLKRVVIMGGSVHRGYGDLGYLPNHGPDPEYNILMSVPSAQKLFTAGVPIEMMPLDSTQLKLDEVKRDVLFTQSAPMTDDLTLLYHQWSAGGNPTPTLYDAMAVAEAIRPDLCPTQPMHITVDDKGFTREGAGTANARVCLDSSSEKFFSFYLDRILHQKLAPRANDACRAHEVPGNE
jgi:purine nucleosidase